MMNSAKTFSSIFLVSIIPFILSQRDPEVCQLFKENKGLLPPPLPRNFEMKGERVNHITKEAFYQELYFDYSNSRGKYMFLENGVEHHLLFDYATAQVIQYDILNPGMDIKKDLLSQTCVASNIAESPHKSLFGFVDEISNHPKMYNSYEALNYGGQYGFVYNGPEVITERHLPSNKFIGCLYKFDTDVTAYVNYSFSTPIIVTSAGTKSWVVTGGDDGSLSVPLKSMIAGTKPSMEDEDQRIKFNYTDSISWFSGEPDFDNNNFQIPPWIHCNGYRGRKEMPKLPTAFSTHVEINILAQDMFGELIVSETSTVEKLYYYKEKKLARRDYIPTSKEDDAFQVFQNFGRVRNVYDFLNGVVYVSHIDSGRCFVRPIIKREFFDTQRDIDVAIMAEPEELFTIGGEEMEYKGEGFSRGITCDIWNGKGFDDRYNATVYRETYFATEGWHEEVEEKLEFGNVLIKHTLIAQPHGGDPIESVKEYNFLKFKIYKPLLYSFKVDNCIETIKHKYFAIDFKFTPEREQIMNMYKIQFLEAAQYYLANITRVISPLRVQKLELLKINAYTFLKFALLDKAPLRTSILLGERGANLEEAIRYLHKKIEEYEFAFEFTLPSSEKEIIVAPRESLYEVLPGGNLTFAPYKLRKSYSLERKDNIEDMLAYADTTKETIQYKYGMSPGGLSALSIAMLAIGIGIGIALMYLYLRKFNAETMENVISLHQHTSLK